MDCLLYFRMNSQVCPRKIRGLIEAILLVACKDLQENYVLVQYTVGKNYSLLKFFLELFLHKSGSPHVQLVLDCSSFESIEMGERYLHLK